jgi:hypothetical protein
MLRIVRCPFDRPSATGLSSGFTKQISYGKLLSIRRLFLHVFYIRRDNEKIQEENQFVSSAIMDFVLHIVLVESMQVCALLGGGGYAEKVNVPAGQVLPIPKGVSLRDAAGFPEVACTVWSTIFMMVHLKKGESVLVHKHPNQLNFMDVLEYFHICSDICCHNCLKVPVETISICCFFEVPSMLPIGVIMPKNDPVFSRQFNNSCLCSEASRILI